MGITRTARPRTATRRRARPRWRSHQRRARRCRLQRRRLATMRTGANYSLWMVGRQARHGGPTCVQNISRARLGAVAGGVAAWVARKMLTNGARTAVQRFLFPKIFPQKIWPKNWGGSSNRKFREWFVCGSGLAPPRPPFVQMKNTPGGSCPRGGFPGAVFGAPDRSLGRSIGVTDSLSAAYN